MRRLRDELMEKMTKRLKENKNLSFEEAVEEIIGDLTLEDFIKLIREYNNPEIAEDLKEIIFGYLLGEIELRWEVSDEKI